MNNYYKAGSWNVICDVCGQKYKSDQLKKRWDGLMVCNKDWEQRHQQDFVRDVPDQRPVPYTRPQPVDVFVTLLCTYEGTSAIANMAVADCSIANRPYILVPDPNLNNDVQNAIANVAIASEAICNRPYSLSPNN